MSDWFELWFPLFARALREAEDEHPDAPVHGQAGAQSDTRHPSVSDESGTR